MKKKLTVILVLYILLVISVSASESDKKDFMRFGVAVPGLSFSLLDFYQAHGTDGATPLYYTEPSLYMGVYFRFPITSYFSIGTDFALVMENHSSSKISLKEDMTVYRLYPSIAAEFSTKSLSGYKNRTDKNTLLSLRGDFSFLFGYSPAFSGKEGSSGMPYIGFKPALVFSVNNMDILIGMQANVLWGCFYKSPHRVVLYDFDFMYAIGWKF